MSKAMKKARILSSESDASIKIKQVQDTNIDLSIVPPAQQVNFQPCAMADLATMAPPTGPHKSTFNPILEEMSQTRCPSEMYIHSSLMHPALMRRQVSESIQTVGPSVQESPQITAKPSPSHEKSLESDAEPVVKEKPLEKPKELARHESRNHMDANGFPILIDRNLMSSELPKLRNIPPPRLSDIAHRAYINEHIDETPKLINDISIIDELKRPEEMLPDQPSIKKAQEEEQERARLREILSEKVKRTEILESMLDVYENKHQTINGLLTCKQKQLEQLINAYCGAEKIELMFEPISCGCTGGSQKLIDIESILVTVNGKTVDFRYGFNDAYADMVRHGINLKQVLA